MSDPNNTPTLLGQALLTAIRQAVRVEIREALTENGHSSQKPTETPNCYLTIKEAADISRLGSSTIRLYIRKRELKAHQVGSRVIIKRIDLEGFLESHPIEILSD